MEELKNNQQSFKNFNDHGVKTLKLEVLKNLDLNMKTNFLGRGGILSSYNEEFMGDFVKEYY